MVVGESGDAQRDTRIAVIAADRDQAAIVRVRDRKDSGGWVIGGNGYG